MALRYEQRAIGARAAAGKDILLRRLAAKPSV
jgi:hypothetical protein